MKNNGDIEFDVLVETYQVLMEHVPSQSKQDVVDSLFRFLYESLTEDQLEEFAMLDRYTKKSFDELVGSADQDSDDYEEDY